MDFIPSIAAIIIGLIAAIPGILAYRNGKINAQAGILSSKAEATAILVDTAIKQQDRMCSEIESLYLEIEQLNTQQAVLKNNLIDSNENFKKCCRSLQRLALECRALIHQLHSKQIEPVVNLQGIESIVNEVCGD